ncbi:MAG TPA: DUF4159 domain-containing protein [Verrucomicrobiae bacterium]|nr:DUF4159 domain-containing protein [Verrucomicrobiae bacterium]
MKKYLAALAILALAVTGALAQRGRFGGGWGWGGDPYHPEFETAKGPRDIPTHSTDTPVWTNTPGFDADSFSFARIRFTRADRRGSGGYWWTDSPDSDLNLSWRLSQMTSIRVNPDGRYLNITDKELFDYPWIYAVEPGLLEFTDTEVDILRKYLQNGGFLMADDFWGPYQWANFEHEIKRVLPGREFVELPMDHPIFHCVFNLNVPKNKLQTPNIRIGRESKVTGITWETHEGIECIDMHVKAVLDDKGRIMVLATHNCDNGDGWEREGEDDYFFHEFSEKRAYPLGINIIFYSMTH